MSILLSNIYCRHWLINDKLKKILENCVYKVLKSNSLHGLHILDSIHYNTLKKNDFSLYEELIVKTKQEEHSVTIFKNLLENFDINKMPKIKVVHNYKLNKYFIIDGVHRMCILLFKNIINERVPLKYLDIKYDNDTIINIKKLLGKSVGISYYNGWNNNRTTFGYHSFKINNINILGQRQPIKRLTIMKDHIDFKNKTIIDFGCNNGGMLLHLSEIKEGIGFDYSQECINSAVGIRDILKYNNSLSFIKTDLNHFNLNDYITQNNVNNIDIIFLLSLGSWIKKWKKLYTESFNNCKTIILEINNDTEGMPQLELFKKLGGDIKMIMDRSIDDTTNNFKRKTYIITKRF